MMADIEVLTEDTAEIAAGEKYSARPAGADKDAFFAEMRPHRANHRHISDAAKTNLALAAIDFTLARTKFAGIYPLP